MGFLLGLRAYLAGQKSAHQDLPQACREGLLCSTEVDERQAEEAGLATGQEIFTLLKLLTRP